MWCAFTELSEMGVHIDVSQTFGCEIAHALSMVRAADPPVSGMGATQIPHLAGPIGTAQSMLDRRRVAECIPDTRSTPKTALSLGLSSQAFRVAFATPGAMPTPGVSPSGLTHMRLSLGTSYANHTGMDSRVPYNMTLDSASQTAMSQGRGHFPVRSGLVLFDTPSSASVAPGGQGGGGKGDPPLFDSPGLTPISGSGRTDDVRNGLSTVRTLRDISSDYIDQEHDHDMSLGLLAGEMDVEIRNKSMRSARFSIGDEESEQQKLFYNPQDMEEDFPSSSFLRPKVNVKARRVSFDPSARLSFDSNGVEEEFLSDTAIVDGGMNESNLDLRDADDVSGSDDSTHPPPKVQKTDPGGGGDTASRDEQYSPTNILSNFNSSTSASMRLHRRKPDTTGASSSSLRSPPRRHDLSARDATSVPKVSSPSRPNASERKLRSATGQTAAKKKAVESKDPSMAPGRARASIGHADPPASLSPKRTSVSPPPQKSASRSPPRSPRAAKGSALPSPSMKAPAATSQKVKSNVSAQPEVDSAKRTDNPQNNDVKIADETGEVEGTKRFLAALLTAFGKAYQLLCQYKGEECIRLLHLLPRKHYSSGWVQHAVGKAYFEMSDYKAAQLALREMLRLEPFRVKGTEILSTALWHLKRDKELCSLAQQVMSVPKLLLCVYLMSCCA